MSKARICATCGHLGEPERRAVGSFWIELCLWLVGLFLWPLLIVALLHTLWRFFARSDACAKCGGKTLLPVDSPIGRSLVESTQGARDAQAAEQQSAEQARRNRAAQRGAAVARLFRGKAK